MSQDVSTGRIVHYRLCENDVQKITERRSVSNGMKFGNPPTVGDVVPLIVARVWSAGYINGQAILDGNDSLWVTSARHDPSGGFGSWDWPQRNGE